MNCKCCKKTIDSEDQSIHASKLSICQECIKYVYSFGSFEEFEQNISSHFYLDYICSPKTEFLDYQKWYKQKGRQQMHTAYNMFRNFILENNLKEKRPDE